MLYRKSWFCVRKWYTRRMRRTEAIWGSENTQAINSWHGGTTGEYEASKNQSIFLIGQFMTILSLFKLQEELGACTEEKTEAANLNKLPKIKYKAKARFSDSEAFFWPTTSSEKKRWSPLPTINDRPTCDVFLSLLIEAWGPFLFFFFFNLFMVKFKILSKHSSFTSHWVKCSF